MGPTRWSDASVQAEDSTIIRVIQLNKAMAFACLTRSSLVLAASTVCIF